MKQDLHIHTIYSDGELNEYEIIEEVLKSDVEEFSICDHDTIMGSEKVYNLLLKDNYKLIFHSGIELSCRYENVNMHLLVRDFKYDDKNMIYLIEKISKLRDERIKYMVEYVNDIYKVNIKEKAIDEILKCTDSFGKPHLYKILLTYGDYDRKEYYSKMDNLNVDRFKLDTKEVFELLKYSGCNITLAHPIEIIREYKLTYQDIDSLICELSKIGLYGVETRHSNQTNSDYLKFSKMAQKYGLVETCGSDFHGEGVKPGIKIGMIEKR